MMRRKVFWAGRRRGVFWDDPVWQVVAFLTYVGVAVLLLLLGVLIVRAVR